MSGNQLIVYGSTGKTLLFSPEELVMPERLANLKVPWIEKQWEQLKGIYIRRIFNLKDSGGDDEEAEKKKKKAKSKDSDDDDGAESDGGDETKKKKSKFEKFSCVENVIAEMTETVEARWHKRKEDKKKYNAAKKQKQREQQQPQHQKPASSASVAQAAVGGGEEEKTNHQGAQKRARDDDGSAGGSHQKKENKGKQQQNHATLDLVEIVSLLRRQQKQQSQQQSMSEQPAFKNARNIVCLTNVAENASERFHADTTQAQASDNTGSGATAAAAASTSSAPENNTPEQQSEQQEQQQQPQRTSCTEIISNIVEGMRQFGDVTRDRWLATDPEQMRSLFPLPEDFRQRQANYVGSDDDEGDEESELRLRERREFDMSVRIDVQLGSPEAAKAAASWADGQWFDGRRLLARVMFDLLTDIDASFDKYKK